MTRLTVFAYEEDGDLFVYRCPECGSTGPVGSTYVAHEPPLSMPELAGPERKPVRVPGVGEELVSLSADEREELRLLASFLRHNGKVKAEAGARLLADLADRPHFTQQQLHDLKFAPRSYTPEQAAVIKDAVANRKPLSTQPLPVQQSSGGQEATCDGSGKLITRPDINGDCREVACPGCGKCGGQGGGVEEGALGRLEKAGELLAVEARHRLGEITFDNPDHPAWQGPQAQALKVWNEARNSLRPDAPPADNSTQPISDYKSGEGK